MFRRALGLAFLALAACGGTDAAPPPSREPPPLHVVAEDPSDAPLPGLSDAELARFEEGDARFELPFRDAQGLGPLYIHRACQNCHEGDGRGPGAVRRIACTDPSVTLPFGDVVRPRTTGAATRALVCPPTPGVREELRLPPAVFARGWLEAIDDAAILAAERAQSERGGAISGRAARLPDGLGRFGHKARAVTLEAFVADALLGDMGLTSPMRPDELPGPEGLADDLRPGVDLEAEDIALMADYVRLLAIPMRAPADARASSLFADVGCADCHVPSLRTRADYPVPLLRDQDAALYTDVLLHDMGEGLADGIAEGVASAREWRTAPLVGVRFLGQLLHDGRATTVADAIAAHASDGSEASEVVARFDALPPADRERIVRFVESL